MVRLKINSKDYEIPTSFDEITMADYCRIFAGLKPTDKLTDVELWKTVRENEATIVSRLMGEEDDFALYLPLPIYDELSKAVKFIYSIDTLQPKSYIVIDDVRYSIPSPEDFNLRQWIDVDVSLQEKEDDTKYIELLSILLMQRDSEGKFIPYKGDNKVLAEKIRNMKASEGLGIVYRFFLKGEISRTLTSISSVVKGQTDQLVRNIPNL